MITKVLKYFILLMILTGCTPRNNITKLTRKTPDLKSLKFEARGIYPRPVINYFVKKLKTPDKISITSGVELYRVSYFTKDENNRKTLVSGLLAFPRNKKIKGVVSYQHGTNS
ncbi:MAG: hypothetical protein WCJ95_21490, partial [Mariniphaga sp.]